MNSNVINSVNAFDAEYGRLIACSVGAVTAIERAARRHKVKSREVLSKSRKKAVAAARVDAMKQCREEFEMTLQEIGAAFNRSHATVLYNLKKGDNHSVLSDSELTC